MKYLLIAILSSPVVLAYQLQPEPMHEAWMQVLHFVLAHLTR